MAGSPPPVVNTPPFATSATRPKPTRVEPTPSPTPRLTIPSTPASQITRQRITLENSARLEVVARRDFQPFELALALAWSPDSSTLAVAAGEQVRLFAAGSFSETLRLEAGVWQTSLAFSPDGAVLAASGRDGQLYAWEVGRGELLAPAYPHPAHRKGASKVAISPDGLTLASTGNDGMAHLWELASGEPVTAMIAGAFATPAIAFTPDGAEVAIVNGPVVRFRTASEGRISRTIRADRSIYAIAMHPTGEYLTAAHDDNSLSIWELGNGSQVAGLVGHTGEPDKPSALVWSVAFDPSGDLLASAGGDGSLRVWKWRLGEALAMWDSGGKALSCLAFSPDGRYLAVSSLDAALVVLAITP